MDIEEKLRTLESEAKRLSGQLGPRSMGTDVQVRAVAWLIEALHSAEKRNRKLSRIMVGLTVAIMAMTAALVGLTIKLVIG